MGDAMSRSCENCAYSLYPCYDIVGECMSGNKHKFPEEVEKEGWPNPPTDFTQKLREALPTEPRIVHAKEKKFSLDKLIDDHWDYVDRVMSNVIPNDAVYTKEQLIRNVRLAYRDSGAHFWKHCMEHYGIEEKQDER